MEGITKPKLYALLVGINAYEELIGLDGNRIWFPGLSACIADTQKIAAYLQQENEFEVFIEILTDEGAIRKQIIHIFKEHLGKAGKDDTAVFYFSGHGTREIAETDLFPSETDGLLECLVCYYSDPDDDFLLADKELRWLISQLAQNGAHVLTIYDCCHSGDNTRNARLLNSSFSKIIPKHIPYCFPKRDWAGFIFSSALNKNVLTEQGEYEVLPQGHHYQFAACESDETAAEISGESIFTAVLIKMLNCCGGETTYYNLGNNLRQYMRYVYGQTPKLYVPDPLPGDMMVNFLNRPARENPAITSEVVFNEISGWQLNLGILHGLAKDSLLYIFDPQEQTETIAAKITDLGLESAQLDINGVLDKGRNYKAKVQNNGHSNLKLFFAEGAEDLQDRCQMVSGLFAPLKNLVNTTANERDAQYVLRFCNGRYFLTYPGDPFRPLLKPVKSGNNNSALQLVSQLDHISKWEFLKNLFNPDIGFTEITERVTITIMIGKGENVYKTIENNDWVEIPYILKEGKWKNSVSIRLTNNSGEKIYCCVLYLTSTFASFPGFLNPQVKMLNTGESVDLAYKGNRNIPVSFDDTMKWYNREMITDHIKIITSLNDFDASLLYLPQAEPPELPGKSRISPEPVTVNVKYKNEGKWSTLQATLVFKNPKFNNVKETDIDEMVNFNGTVDFARGIYFDPTTGRLKTELKIY